MKKIKLRKKPFIILIISLILITCIILYILKITSLSYKLEKIGYSEKETEQIEKLNIRIDDILNMEYNKYLVGIISEKYYLDKNFNKYLDYAKEVNEDYDKIVAKVNVNSNNEFYTDSKKANTSQGNLILVNKFNYIDETYETNLVDADLSYAYSTIKINKEVYDAFVNMADACNKENKLKLLILDGYRDYESQKEQYEYYKTKGGIELADSYAARPGYSEHQTGLAIDVNVYPNYEDIDFEEFDEFKWLEKHAHEYGFILRYPKGKEDITGYSYESWHYRYVGVEIATKIKDLGITYDEYYAYFIDGNTN